MRKTAVIAAIICAMCLMIPFNSVGVSLGIAQHSQSLTSKEAIAAARSKAKPGSSFTVLREIVADANTRRVGDQALEQAKAHKIDLYGNPILPDLMRSGGFLVGEYDPETTKVVALHLIWLGPDGAPNDIFHPCDSVVKLADAEELVKDTAEFAEQLYSTPSSEASSLESKFYGGRFPECDPSEECTLFAIPRSLLNLGADQDEVREVVALSSGLAIWHFRYAVSMPVFAASPLAALQASEGPLEEFLRNNHMDPDFDFDPEKIRSKEELRERIDLLRRLDKFLEETLRKKADPALVKANLSVAVIPFDIGTDTRTGKVVYDSDTASGFVIGWQRLPAGGFAVRLISEAAA